MVFMQIYHEYRLKPVSDGKISMDLIIARKRKVRKENCNFFRLLKNKLTTRSIMYYNYVMFTIANQL